MKQEYIKTVIFCDNCSKIIVEIEGSVPSWDYDYSAHLEDEIDECQECHQYCIEEGNDDDEEEEEISPILSSDGKDLDLGGYF